MKSRALFFREHLVGQVPYVFGGFAVEHAVVAKIFFEFQMRPVHHRIADRVFERFGEFLKFFAVGRIAGDVRLVDAVGAHKTPFVVVATQPDLGNVFKLAVFRDFFWRKMAMVV